MAKLEGKLVGRARTTNHSFLRKDAEDARKGQRHKSDRRQPNGERVLVRALDSD